MPVSKQTQDTLVDAAQPARRAVKKVLEKMTSKEKPAQDIPERKTILKPASPTAVAQEKKEVQSAPPKKGDYLYYKGRPLVRVGRELYYGSLSDPYVAHMQIVNAKEFKDLHMSDKIVVMLLKTDPSVAPKDRIAKRTESHGLFRAVDVAEVWLNRYVK